MTDKGTSGQSVQKSPELPEGLFLMDGIEGLRSLPRHSVDMLLTDPPYGTIAPDSFDFRQSRTFRIGQYWGAASYLQILASELSDKLLAEILELDAEMLLAFSMPAAPR